MVVWVGLRLLPVSISELRVLLLRARPTGARRFKVRSESFNLRIESLVIERPPQPTGDPPMSERFNLRIESLVIERYRKWFYPMDASWVSISELRVLLLRDPPEWTLIGIVKVCFNLRIESLVIESITRDMIPSQPLSYVSISELRVLLLRETQPWPWTCSR